MGIGTSIVVFAIGAILKFATTVHTSSFNIQTIGVILMIVGAVGFVLSLIFWASWGGFGGYRRRRRVYQEPYAPGAVPPVAGGQGVVGRPGYPVVPPAGRTVVEEDDRAF
ncbi:MAG TPA: hypothetical protein VKU88_11945 [Acidimicrobiales bacterium]|nr:hypothetical protein [Acidimicrobiales bacterium]